MSIPKKPKKKSTITERVAAHYRIESENISIDTNTTPLCYDTPTMSQLSGKPAKARRLAQTALRVTRNNCNKSSKIITKKPTNLVLSPDKAVNIIRNTSLTFPRGKSSKQRIDIQKYLNAATEPREYTSTRVLRLARCHHYSSQNERPSRGMALWHESTRLPSDLGNEDFINLHGDMVTASQNSLQVDRQLEESDESNSRDEVCATADNSFGESYQTVANSISGGSQTVDKSISEMSQTVDNSISEIYQTVDTINRSCQTVNDSIYDDHNHIMTGDTAINYFKQTMDNTGAGCHRSIDLISSFSEISDSEDNSELNIVYMKTSQASPDYKSENNSQVSETKHNHHTVVLVSSSPEDYSGSSVMEYTCGDESQISNVIEIPDSQEFSSSICESTDVVEIPESPGNPLDETLFITEDDEKSETGVLLEGQYDDSEEESKKNNRRLNPKAINLANKLTTASFNRQELFEIKRATNCGGYIDDKADDSANDHINNDNINNDNANDNNVSDNNASDNNASDNHYNDDNANDDNNNNNDNNDNDSIYNDHENNNTDYNSMTTADLRKLIKSWGFKPVRSRDKMLQLVHSANYPSQSDSDPTKAIDQDGIKKLLFKRISYEIKTNPSAKVWWYKILFYEPLVIEKFTDFINKDLGIQLTIDMIKDWCDYTGVTFTYEKAKILEKQPETSAKTKR